MGIANARAVMTVSDDLPLTTARPVHSGKVRSVYFLDGPTSQQLIDRRGYRLPAGSLLALMVISDRLSAFDCLWQAETLPGVPGKGAALNAVAAHWFDRFDRAGLGPHHLLEMPHPMLWVVRQSRPVMIEAIARRYLTGSLLRAYEGGQRRFGDYVLADGLAPYSQLPELWFTPSTKGVMRGIPGVPETDDAPVTLAQVQAHPDAFGFSDPAAVTQTETVLGRGFELVESALADNGELLVDTKFEFGYAPGTTGAEELIIIDEVVTPDSSRIWRRDDWEAGAPREHSKELFREALLGWVDDRSMLLDPQRMAERSAYAASRRVPDEFFLDLAATYADVAERWCGAATAASEDPREELLTVLADDLGLI